MRKSDTWLRWPDRDCWVAFLGYGVLLNLLWCLVYGGASYVTSLHAYRVRLHLNAELNVPFVPGAAVVYLSLFPMLWLSVFVLHTVDQLQSFAKALAVLFVVSGLGFALLPADDVRTRDLGTDLFSQIYDVADWINLSHNYLPSLHVGMAVLSARNYARVAPLRIAIWIWLWAAAIAISTLLIHEHYIADVATGGVLGYLIANSANRRGPCAGRRCLPLA